MLEIRRKLARKPFQPFVLNLVDGRTVSISTPEMVNISRRKMMIVGPDDSLAFVDAKQVASLGPLPKAE